MYCIDLQGISWHISYFEEESDKAPNCIFSNVSTSDKPYVVQHVDGS